MLSRVAASTVVQCVLMFATAIGFLLDPTQSSGSRTISPTSTTVMKIPTTPKTTQPHAATAMTPTGHTESRQPTTCEDTIPTCYQYGRGPCKDPVYEPWARSHCALYCGFCNSTVSTPLACKNRLGNCGEYDGGDLCSSPSYYTWAYENCKVYCSFDGCGVSVPSLAPQNTVATPVTVSTGSNAGVSVPSLASQNTVATPVTVSPGSNAGVDGNWADWSVWSNCDKTCDNGTQVRTRTCTNDRPSPAHGAVPAGNPCVGTNSETQTCTRDFCPVHGSWGSWSVWGECSVTCGVGMQRRDRHCDDPYPARNGDHCFGEGAAYRICLPGACADGDWSSWEGWSNCSIGCGGGMRSRNRTCDNPPPSPLGRGCQGNFREVDTCNDSPCAIDGGWAHWNSWSACDVSCNNGTMSRLRTCTHPSPAHGGSDCPGQNKQNLFCHMPDCPVSGEWSVWSPWGSCSVSCGVGLQRRDRSCSNPYPERFGDHCFGDDKVYRSCFDRSCSDGAWTTWSSWGTCSATCNGGLQSRNRNCTNPAPSKFGRACIGSDMDKQLCNSHNCPERRVGFSVYFPHSALTSDDTPTFYAATLNTGSYDMTTGKFTSPVAGLYSFSLTIRVGSSSTTQLYCRYRINGVTKSWVYTYQDAYGSASGTMNANLNVGDVVDLYCSGWNHNDRNYDTAFSGVLITPA